MAFCKEKCRPHGIISSVICTNILAHGKRCPQLICDDCFEYSESYLSLLPHRTSIFCIDCIQNIHYETKCKPHGITSNTKCDNLLPSGKPCHQLICKYCIDNSNASHELLHSSLASYCEDCIDALQLISCNLTQASGNLRTHETIEINQRPSTDNKTDDAFTGDIQTPICLLTPMKLGLNTNTSNLFVDLSTESSSDSSIDSLFDKKQPARKSFHHDDLSQQSHSESSSSMSNETFYSPVSRRQLFGIEDTTVSQSNAPCSGLKACNQYLTQVNDACCSDTILDIDLNEDNLHDNDNDSTDDDGTRPNTDDSNPYNSVTAIVPNNTIHSSNTIHAPAWYLTAIQANCNKSHEEIHADLSVRNWITTGLLSEIQSMYPTASESRTNAVTAVCYRDLDAFNSKCTSLFPKDRVFMSKTQLDQAANHFLNGWNCKKVHAGKSVRFFYSAPTKKAYVSKCAPSKQRKK